MTQDAHRAVEAVWRIESARVVGALVRLVRDVGLAEEFAQEALVQALEQWPRDGVPRNAGAWLTATARRRAIDHIRRQATYERKLAEIGHELETSGVAPEQPGEALEDEFGDDVLRLVFMTCHPVLSTEARVALTLRLLGGLTTDEIARAFLVPESTVAQRIVRAKKTLAKAGVPFEVPSGEELGERLASVLEVLYLVFNEGYAATAGDRLVRHDLVEEAMRLGRVLVGLAPAEPEAHALVALMEIQASRSRARTAPDGTPVLLLDQDRTRWDRLLIHRGLAALERAEALAGADRGPYLLQAAIAACHARALRAEDTDWARIAELYAELAALAPSPVVELNRAMAIAMSAGPGAGLAHVDTAVDAGRLAGYPLLPGVRGDLLARLGRHAEAAAEFDRAAELTRNDRERAIFRGRAEENRAEENRAEENRAEENRATARPA